MTNKKMTCGTMFLQIRRKRRQIASFEEASRIFCALKDESDRRTLYRSRAPEALIINESETILGHVSPNGRVWKGTPREWTPDQRLLFDNRTAS